jgi:hypothetical protein
MCNAAHRANRLASKYGEVDRVVCPRLTRRARKRSVSRGEVEQRLVSCNAVQLGCNT